MSRQRTIWLKINTLCPPAFSLGSSLSMSTSFPAAWIIAWRAISGTSILPPWESLNSSMIFSSAPRRQTGKDNHHKLHSGPIYSIIHPLWGRASTIYEVGVVAALPQLHHGVEEVGHTSWSTSSCASFGQEGEVFLQNGPIVFLLDVGQLHLTTTNRSAYFISPLEKLSYKRKLFEGKSFTSIMVSSLGARFFSTSSFSLLSIMGFKIPWSFWTWYMQRAMLFTR